MYKYSLIIYWSHQANAYIAEVPDLPGCMAEGKNYDEVMLNIKITIKERVNQSIKLGNTIPKPTFGKPRLLNNQKRQYRMRYYKRMFENSRIKSNYR